MKPEKKVIVGKGRGGGVCFAFLILAYLGRKSKQLHFIEQLHYRIQQVLSDMRIYL